VVVLPDDARRGHERHHASMRRALVLGLLVAAVAVAVAFGLLGDDSAARRTGAVTMVGDSLNVGVEPFLGQALDGWELDGDNVVGRGSDDGIAALRRLGSAAAPVVVISLGTNDPQDDAEAFRSDVRAVLTLAGPQRCVVWATIVRDGPNDAFNDVLHDEADENRWLHLVEWDEMVAAHPDWLAADGVHGTPDGYRARAAAIADVAADCLPAGAS
jgi:lysophospholipase L1-like esterase